jgi:hypothetical protein
VTVTLGSKAIDAQSAGRRGGGRRARRPHDAEEQAAAEQDRERAEEQPADGEPERARNLGTAA